jgi:glucosamine--fructose-6-phosphate aminotransferase (isomerizing)
VCGIFGLFISDRIDRGSIKKIISLADLSARRGSDASGLMIMSDQNLKIFKKNSRIQELIKDIDFDLNELVSTKYILGHSRLSTHGDLSDDTNQPISESGWLILHNGIITNHLSFKKSPLLEFSDSAAIGAALKDSKDISAIELALNDLLGEITCILISPSQEVFAYTNVGNLFSVFDKKGNQWVASEKIFLEKLHKGQEISQIPLNKVIQIISNTQEIVDIDFYSLSDYSEFSLEEDQPQKALPHSLQKLNGRLAEEMENLQRCNQCILPISFPGLKLDDFGICSICNSWAGQDRSPVLSLDDLAKKVGAGSRIQVNLSGGRDSCYMLIRLCELGYKPYAFTYDWGLITTAARENMAKLCGKLGVEHVMVSPNLREIRMLAAISLRSWFKFQDPTAIPALMAGDKPFFHFAQRVSAENNGAQIFQGDHIIESTHFKSALSGGSASNAPGNGAVAYRLNFLSLVRMSTSYLKLIRYAEAHKAKLLSILIKGAYFYYFEKHPFVHYFGFEKWDENLLNQRLDQYGWSSNQRNTLQKWRMGDATSPLYNLLYLLTIGFTENDAFRSNQVREGLIDRSIALRNCIEENKVDYLGIVNYLQIIGFTSKEFWSEISTMLKKAHPDLDFSDCVVK